jgi:hypothetical protein
MYYFKRICLLTGILFLVACGENSKNKEYQDKLAQLIHEKDSLKQELTKLDTVAHLDTLVSEEKVTPVSQADKTRRAGKHPISLQWIGWDKPGSAEIKPLDGGWYSVSGSQKNSEGDYLTIDGKIKRITKKELEFDGTIVTKVKYNNNGEPCIKEGKQTFYAKGKRKYFRLQNMENCEGGMLVDYVDIYAGTSSL